jgi:hypothetical protein
MTDVNITPFGRQLMTLAIGRIAYSTQMTNRNIQLITSKKQEIDRSKENLQLFQEMSFDMTVSMLDKRFNASKGFIQTGGTTAGKFKKSLTDEQVRIQNILETNSIKARTKYNQTISSYNQMIQDKKMQSAVRKLNLEGV